MTSPLGGFGGYNPDNAPPGYDPVCWRATNWDLGHGLICYAPKGDTLRNTYNTLTDAQKAQADALLKNYDDPTMLVTNLRSWLPWTWDFGANPPPSDSVYLYLGSAVLPWPGKLTATQSRALYSAIATKIPNLSNAEFLTILAKVKADNPENPNVVEWTPTNPTPTSTTTFTLPNGDVVVYDGTWYTLPDGTKVRTAAEAGLAPASQPPVFTPPPTISGSIPPGPTSNVFPSPTTIPIDPTVTALPPVPATGGQASVGSPIPQILPAGTPTFNATATPTPVAPSNSKMILAVLAIAVVIYLLAE